ncbi:hypothetical protein MKX01_026023 [Papaver californicum]|nr:hypothetical protein MKX01_026023 [Papaver californicum]
MGLQEKLKLGVTATRVEAVGMDTLGISSCPKEKKRKGVKNSQPLNTRILRSHVASRFANQSAINENVATGDIPTKVTGESFGCSNHEARQTGSNECPPATLEFHVRSEEGINIFVDLDSSLSDWTKKLKSELCIHPEKLNANSRVLHRELGIFSETEEQMKASFLGNTAVNLKTTGDPKVIEPFPSSDVRDIPEENIKSSATIPNYIAESIPVRESDPKVSSLCYNYSQNSVDLNSDSHLQNGNETFVSAGSKLSDISENGSKTDSKCPASAETFPMSASVSSKPDLPIVSKFCEDRISPITSALENPGGVIPMCSTGDSMGMQSSEVTSYSNDTEKCSLHILDRSDLDASVTYLQTDKGRPGNKEPGQNTNDYPLYASSEEGGGSNPISEKDSSECSQINKLSKRSFNCSDNPEPGGLQINRRTTRSQNRKSNAILTLKKNARKVFPTRSSPRLVSK